MSVAQKARYNFMKDLGAPALMRLRQMQRKRRPYKPNPHLGPPLKCSGRLKEIMTRHYYLSRFSTGAMPVAWVTSGAPVELLRAFDFYTVYPENHGALCGAQKAGPEICSEAEKKGYHPDLCSYARIDLGHAFSGKTPAGRLPSRRAAPPRPRCGIATCSRRPKPGRRSRRGSQSPRGRSRG